MRKTIYFVSLVLILSSLILGQEKSEENKLSITFGGYVKTDLMFDSRQTVTAREGHLLLFPAPEKLDINGNDINDKPNLNILSIQSRASVSVKGLNILGAKASSFLEGSFFGSTNSDINEFRLRHAIVKLDWEKTSLLVGQYWHPLFIEDVFPGVVSFNTGIPFMPFSRNPQLKVSQMLGDIKLSFTAASQRDFSSNGPKGSTSDYLRNSAIPILNLTAKYLSKNIVLGGGINFQSIQPELETTLNHKSNSKINSLSAVAFAKYKVDDFEIKIFGMYGENVFDLLMIGGYGVKSTHGTTGENTYTNLKTTSYWVDLVYGKEISYGLFAGYSSNHGSDDEVVGSVYARGSDINHLFRISPRVEFNFSPVRFSFELEYTSTAYGVSNKMYVVEDYKNINNIRSLIAVYYFF